MSGIYTFSMRSRHGWLSTNSTRDTLRPSALYSSCDEGKGKDYFVFPQILRQEFKMSGQGKECQDGNKQHWHIRFWVVFSSEWRQEQTYRLDDACKEKNGEWTRKRDRGAHLFHLKDLQVEVLLQFLVRKVNAQLLEAVRGEHFEAENIQHACDTRNTRSIAFERV